MRRSSTGDTAKRRRYLVGERCRPALVPAGGAFISSAGSEQRRLLPGPPDELHTHRRVVRRETYRHTWLLADGSAVTLWELVHNMAPGSEPQHEVYAD